MAYGDLVQSAESSTNGASLDVAYPSSPTAGNTLFAAVCAQSGADLTMAGSANTFTQQAIQEDNGTFLQHRHGYVLSAAGAAETVSFTGPEIYGAVVAELSGASDSALSTQTGGFAFGTAISTTGYTVTAGDLSNGSVLFLGSSGADAGGVTATPGGSWSEINETGGATRPCWTARQVKATEGELALDGTWSGNTDWFARITVLKPTGGVTYLLT